jgi:hypothetical protein
VIATEELSQLTGKSKGSIDADTLVPFTIMMIIMAKE